MVVAIVTGIVVAVSSGNILAGLGAAASLAISDVPFNGPMGYAKVGKIDGNRPEA
jgi:polyribonucleotide nucleotidyltransferase